MKTDESKIFDPRSSEEVFSKRRLTLADRIQVGEKEISVDQIIARLEPVLTQERVAKLHTVARERSFQFVSVLENIYDRGNVSAVMRSADAFGFFRMHLVDLPGAKFKAANRVSKGAEKWLDVRLHSSPATAVSELHEAGYKVYVSDLATDRQLADIDFSKPTAIVLGNEKDGCSEEMKSLANGRFRIPMFGFSQSFNISVAAALIFYHARLQQPRTIAPDSAEYRQILANYMLRCFDNPEIYF